MSTKRKPQSRNPAARPGDRPRVAPAPGGGSTRAGGGSRGAPAPEVATVPVGGATKAAAVGLWAVVGAGLVYGISQTAVKVVALFGG